MLKITDQDTRSFIIRKEPLQVNLTSVKEKGENVMVKVIEPSYESYINAHPDKSHAGGRFSHRVAFDNQYRYWSYQLELLDDALVIAFSAYLVESILLQEKVTNHFDHLKNPIEWLSAFGYCEEEAYESLLYLIEEYYNDIHC